MSVYLDDVLIFSETLDEHLEHLELAISHVEKAGMKLTPSKCQVVWGKSRISGTSYHSRGTED